MNALWDKITSGIFTLLITIAGFFGQVQIPLGGEQFAVGGEIYYLSGSGITSTQTTINLTKFGYTNPDLTYQKFSMTSFGDLGCGTLQPGNVSGKQEFVSFTGITQNSDGTAQLTGITRGLERFASYTASTTLQTAHAGGTKFVISNSPPCFYEIFANRTASSTITGRWTYDIYPVISGTANATTSRQLTTKGYVDALSNQGAATSSETIAGIVEQSTQTEMASSTQFDADNPHVINSEYATSSPYTHSAGPGNFAAITETDLYLNQSFLDLSENFNFTGNLSRGTSTPAASFAQQGDAMISGTTTTGGLTASSSASIGGNLTVTNNLTVSGTCSGCGNTITSYIPKASGAATTTDASGAGNTVMHLHQFEMPFRMTLANVSFSVSVVTAAGAVNFKIYSEDGQTAVLGTTTPASISAVGIVTTAASSSVSLNPGVYYFGFNEVGTADLRFRVWDYNSQPWGDLTDPTGEPRSSCKLTVPAGQLIGTFTPTTCGTAGTDDYGLVVRFDN